MTSTRKRRGKKPANRSTPAPTASGGKNIPASLPTHGRRDKRAQRKYRVFISYSHRDRQLVQDIAGILQNNGLEPMWDDNLLPGQGFGEQIKNYIAHSHVFLPVLTPTANSKKWVHQEIGFATALNVPVLPVEVIFKPSLPATLLRSWRQLLNLMKSSTNCCGMQGPVPKPHDDKLLETSKAK